VTDFVCAASSTSKWNKLYLKLSSKAAFLSHSPHVAYGHLNMVNGFASKHFDNWMLWENNAKINIFLFDLHFKKHQNEVKRCGPGHKICKQT